MNTQLQFQIELMQFNDLDQVLEHETISHQTPWTKGQLLDSIESGYWAYVMISNNAEYFEKKILGHCILMPGVDELHLLDIVVAPQYRNQGIAKRTLLAMESIAIERNLSQILLEVRISNTIAIALYKKIGFKELGVRKNYYRIQSSDKVNVGREDALIMAKVLN